MPRNNNPSKESNKQQEESIECFYSVSFEVASWF